MFAYPLVHFRGTSNRRPKQSFEVVGNLASGQTLRNSKISGRRRRPQQARLTAIPSKLASRAASLNDDRHPQNGLLEPLLYLEIFRFPKTSAPSASSCKQR